MGCDAGNCCCFVFGSGFLFFVSGVGGREIETGMFMTDSGINYREIIRGIYAYAEAPKGAVMLENVHQRRVLVGDGCCC